MRYMMLIYTTEGDLSRMPAEEAQQIREAHAAVMHETRERGMLVAVNGLGRTGTATTVRIENGKVLATDGLDITCSIAWTWTRRFIGRGEFRRPAAVPRGRSRSGNSRNLKAYRSRF